MKPLSQFRFAQTLVLAAALGLGIPASRAAAPSSNQPPVVDMVSIYWELDNGAGFWRMHHVVKAHDVDSPTLWAKVLVFDRNGAFASENLLGTEPPNGVIDSDGWSAVPPATESFGRMEVTVWDEHGNTLAPVILQFPGTPDLKAPKLRRAKIDRRTGDLILKGKRLTRIVGVDKNGESVESSGLGITRKGKTVRIPNAVDTLGLVPGLNSIVVRTPVGASNEIVVNQ